MESLDKTLCDVHEWAIHRMNVLCALGTIEDIEEAESIRQEFKEWLIPESEDHDIFSMEYIGEGSGYE